jgi:hypothetical protein
MANKSKRRTAPKKSRRAAAPAARRNAARRNVKPWTEEDVRQLRRLAGTMPATQVGKALKRSLAAVTFKAFTLRISLRVSGSNRGRRSQKRPAR